MAPWLLQNLRFNAFLCVFILSASSAHAVETANKLEPLAGLAWKQAQEARL